MKIGKAGYVYMRKEEDCSSLLYRIRPSGPTFKFYPHRATLNYYIGCSHNCQYCYARYTMKNVGWEPNDFGRNICIKANAVEVLKKELDKKTWKQTYNGIIHLGTVQDPFQPIERQYHMTDKILNLLYENRKPVTILTKSTYVLESLEVLKKMASENLVHIDFSIAYTDEELRQKLEPGAPSFEERFCAMKTLHDNGISVGIFLNPVIPYYTNRNLEDIFSRGWDCGIAYVMLGFIHLNRGNYADLKRCLAQMKSDMDVDRYFNLNGRSICVQEEECMEVSKNCYELSRKYGVPLITSKYHQFLTGEYDFGVFRYRYPLVFDYIKLMKQNVERKVSFSQAVEMADRFCHDKSYITSLKWYWENEKLFSDFKHLNIEVSVENEEKYYTLHSGPGSDE